MAKNWHDRWGENAHTHKDYSLDCYDKMGNLTRMAKPATTHIQCTASRAVCLKLDSRVMRQIKTRVLLGMSGNIKIKGLIPYRTASIKPELVTRDYVSNGMTVTAEYKGNGTWHIKVR